MSLFHPPFPRILPIEFREDSFFFTLHFKAAVPLSSSLHCSWRELVVSCLPHVPSAPRASAHLLLPPVRLPWGVSKLDSLMSSHREVPEALFSFHQSFFFLFCRLDNIYWCVFQFTDLKNNNFQSAVEPIPHIFHFSLQLLVLDLLLRFITQSLGFTCSSLLALYILWVWGCVRCYGITQCVSPVPPKSSGLPPC